MPPSSNSKEAVHQTYQSKRRAGWRKESQTESSGKSTPAAGHCHRGKRDEKTKRRGKDRMTQQELTLQRLLCMVTALIGEQADCLLAGTINQLCWLLLARADSVRDYNLRSAWKRQLILSGDVWTSWLKEKQVP